MQLSIANPAEALREGGPRSLGGRGGRRLHQALVVVELALAVVLLSGAGLLIRSFLRVQAADRGFDSRNVLLLQVDLPRTYNNREKAAAFFTEAMQRIRALPGVVAAGAISDFFIHRQPDYRIALEGQPPRRPEDPAPPLTEDQVVPGYFEAMRIPLLRGRLLHDSDLAAGCAAGGGDQRRDGAAVLAGRGSGRQAAEVRTRSRREHAVENGGRCRRRHATAAPG